MKAVSVCRPLAPDCGCCRNTPMTYNNDVRTQPFGAAVKK
jgi:hypothetical protein